MIFPTLCGIINLYRYLYRYLHALFSQLRSGKAFSGGTIVRNTFKKAIDILSNAALVLFVLLVILLAGVRLFGIEPHIVLSGSMEPEIMTGSLVYIRPLSAEETRQLQAGDTVTYIVDKNGTKVTHKIYEVVGIAHVKNQHGEYVLDESGQPIVAIDDFGNPIVMYTTYGVNNKSSSTDSGYVLDGPLGVGNLASSNVVGKPVFTVPLLGYIAHFVQNPPGKYVTIAICVILLFNIFFDGSSKKKSRDAEAQAEPSDVPVPTEVPPTDTTDKESTDPTQE